jgi:hypothetical protein
VLELPLDSHQRDLAAMYRAMSHGRPIVNGYSGHLPAPVVALRIGLTHGDAGALVPLAELTALDILVHTTRDPADPAWSAQAAIVESLGATLVDRTDSHRLYHLARRRPAVEPPPGTEVTVTQVTSRHRAVTARMTNRLSPDFLFTDGIEATLDGRRVVSEVQIVLAPGPVALSVAGAGGDGPWQDLWAGPVGERMVRGALADPRYPRLRLRFAPREVEHLRVTIHMPHAGDVIGMRELRVFSE